MVDNDKFELFMNRLEDLVYAIKEQNDLMKGALSVVADFFKTIEDDYKDHAKEHEEDAFYRKQHRGRRKSGI